MISRTSLEHKAAPKIAHLEPNRINNAISKTNFNISGQQHKNVCYRRTSQRNYKQQLSQLSKDVLSQTIYQRARVNGDSRHWLNKPQFLMCVWERERTTQIVFAQHTSARVCTISLHSRHLLHRVPHSLHTAMWPHGPNTMLRFWSLHTMHSSSNGSSLWSLATTSIGGGSLRGRKCDTPKKHTVKLVFTTTCDATEKMVVNHKWSYFF